MEMKVRIAPSPTGNLHIGTARTALFNYLYAKKYGAKFVLRIEDTDLERSDPKYERDITYGLKWLGLDWDEGPHKQSDRLEFYKKYIQQLLNDEKAFWCYHTAEELEQERKDQMENKVIPRHVCSYKKDGEIKQDARGIIRLAVDEDSERKISFQDNIRGVIEIEERLLGDISIAKDEDTPLYNFAVVCDDNDMGITHVIRGEDHISNTPKQILIQEALEFPRPEYTHLPLILGPDKSKMSKRHGAVSITDYKHQGYLNKSLVNYMSMLGFTLPENNEIMPIEKIIDLFELSEIHKSGAIFDIKKLDWINSQYIKQMSDEELLEFIRNYLGDKFNNNVRRSAHMIRERISKFSDLEEFDFLYKEPVLDKEMLVWRKGTIEDARRALDFVEEVVAGYEPNVIRKAFNKFFDKNPYEGIRHGLDNIAKSKFDGDRGAVYWPFRVALSGRKHSPDPIEIINSIGKDKAISRIKRAIQKLI